MNFETILHAVQADERYLGNLEWGKPRPGHPESTLRAHIEELEGNLNRLKHKLPPDAPPKLRLLIHVHDICKPLAERGVAIADPRSHASLARVFLAEFCADEDLLAMVQYHDEPYALWRKEHVKKQFDRARFDQLLARICDWNLFTAFLMLDGCTRGKDRAPLQWFLFHLRQYKEVVFSEEDLF